MSGRIVSDSLVRNALLLIVNSGLTSALGLAFWVVAAHRFQPEEVGTVAAWIAWVTLASAVATLGLPQTVVRFQAQARDPRGLVRAAVLVTAAVAGAVGIVGAATGLHPGGVGAVLGSGVRPLALLVATVCASATGMVWQSALVASRRSQWVLAENLVGSVVKLGAVVAVGATAGGLFGSWLVGMVASTAATGLIAARLVPRGQRHGRTDLGALRTHTGFALGSGTASLVATVPATALPMVVLARLGGRQAAFFAVPFLIVTVLNVVPSMAAQSLFAETSATAPVRRAGHVRRAGTLTAVLMAPAIALVIGLAPVLLSVFGPGYRAQGTACLRWMALAATAASCNYLADTILLVRRRVRAYLVVNVAGTVAVVGSTWVGMSHGLSGLGLGWLVGQVLYGAIATTGLALTTAADRRPGLRRRARWQATAPRDPERRPRAADAALGAGTDADGPTTTGTQAPGARSRRPTPVPARTAASA